MSLGDWYRLTKPGIVYGNSLHVVAGVMFAASHYQSDWSAVLGVIIGTALVIASACVANNYLDRHIDAKMPRTKKRASAAGKISLLVTVIYAGSLALIGGLLLVLLTNWLTVILGVISYISYVWVYGYAKRTTIHSTLVGSLPGALPIMAGYVAVSGSLDWLAWALFVMLFIWQLPHFYAIAIFRKSQYAKTKLPIISLVWSQDRLVNLIRWDVCLYFGVTLITSLGLLSWPAAIILILAAGYWLYVTSRAVGAPDKWARKVFGGSLIVTLCLALAAAANLAVSLLGGLY